MDGRLERLREKAFIKTKQDLKKELIRRDNLIVQTVKTVDVLDKSVNLMTEQLKDWYALYFPELARIVENIDDYVKLVGEIGFKRGYLKEAIEKVAGNKGYASKLEEIAKTSMGADIKEFDIEQMIRFAQKVYALRIERQNLDKYLKEIMKEEAPNITALIGPTIGARLIASAGSLEKFSRMPSSTVQVIGAEKALFSHIKRGTASPKYGIIFQYPKLRGAPKKIRGKIARHLASKLSIASKLDFFKGENQGEEMSKNLEKYIEELGKRTGNSQ